ncbi:MAG: ATP-dependent DNA helicase RecG [Patescibacteria group bacterium]|nr:ATP-dependent DNA helicase RecG [Patescibacteria group bacterium]MDW8279955.1 ATP-dependent DNA helicase RecG [bacterium]
MQKLDLENDISLLTGFNTKITFKLKKIGINTILDLLKYFPFRYEDFSKIYNISEIEPNQNVTIQAKIKSLKVHRSWQRKIIIVEAILEDKTGQIKAVWFNQPFLKNILKVGKFFNFSGKVSFDDKNEIYLAHPIYETIDLVNNETKHTARLVPIYSETKGLTSKLIRNIIKTALKTIKPLKEWIPYEILIKYNFPEINQSFKLIHFPNKLSEALRAKKRFAFEDIFLLQIYNLKQKLNLNNQKSFSIKTDLEWLKKILAKLPFELTFSQKKALWEILQDLNKEKPMNRLLQGDVGSGKTIVSALSCLVCAKNGYQSVLMAPTEVLAIQHYNTFKNLFNYISLENQPVLGLLTSSNLLIFYENDVESKVKKDFFKKEVLNNKINIIIGTHALIQKTIEFNNLGFVVVDEQHRFGVNQRAALLNKKNYIPHFLSMSATPIPRTLMLTIFGDLDISLISELPKGRKPIITKIISPENRLKAYNFIKEQIKIGRQAFVICPRIESSNNELNKEDILKLDIKNVEEEYKKLSEKIFPEFKVGMLHGKLKSKEKNEIMQKFKNNEINILVSTSVIEVGVDVPNATIMMIEGAERFGLSQLYQFRGRVGRGEHQSYCFLFTDSNSKTTRLRLEALIKAKNGFELAEIDLKLRGPGEFLGEKQTGFPDLSMKGLMDVELIKNSREAANLLFKKNPQLDFKNNKELLKKLEEFQKRIHLE